MTNPPVFERKEKYIVIKIEDARKYLSEAQQSNLAAILQVISIGRYEDGKDVRNFVCISDKLPIYEQVWKLLEKQCTYIAEKDIKRD